MPESATATAGQFADRATFAERGRSPLAWVGRAWRRHTLACVAGVVIALFVVAAIFAPLLAPHSYKATDAFQGLKPPSWSHPFGRDDLGRDVFSRVLYGARVSLEVAIMAVVFAGGIGVPIGLAAGFFGGAVDMILMRIVDGVIAFPALVLALALVLVLGPTILNIMLAVGISASPLYARLVRGQVLSLKQTDFVLAARALGASDGRLMLRHIWPNTIAPVIIAASLSMAGAILAEAALSFLGVGVRPPTPTWGGMLNESFGFIYVTPWLSFFPGMAIFLLTLAFNLLGDGLRDALDPHLRHGSG